MVKLLGGSSDLQQVVSDMNTNLLELKNNEVAQYFKDDTGTRRVLLGKGADGFYGMKVSQTGFDVFSAADDELVFNSDNNAFKIVDKQSLDFTYTNPSGSAPGTTSVTLTHNLGYIPTVQAAVEVTTNTVSGGDLGLIPLPFIQMGTVTLPTLGTSFFAPLVFVYFLKSTTTTIQFVVGTQFSETITGTLHVYIMQETAN